MAAEGTEQVGGIALGLGLDTSGFSAGISKAKAELATLEATPVRIKAEVVPSRGVSVDVTPAFVVDRKAITSFRSDIDEHFRGLGTAGAVAIPIKLARINYGAMRAEIAAGIGVIPIKVAVSGKASATNLIAATVSEAQGEGLASATSFVTNAARKRGLTPRRFGGPVMPGRSYLVGEEGPEELHMQASGGYVRPMSRGGLSSRYRPMWSGGRAQAYAATQQQGGGTFDPFGHQPQRGYAVSVGYGTAAQVPANDRAGFARGFHQVRRMGAPYVGTWLHEGDIHIDPVEVLRRQRTANDVARRNAQYAYYDIGHGREIDTERRRFDPVPGQTRLPGFAAGGRVPIPHLRDVARAYTRSVGRPDPIEGIYHPLDADFGLRTARAYEALPTQPDEASRRSYRAFIDETMAQSRILRAAGYGMTPSREDPYAPTSGRTKMQLAAEDVRRNKNLNVFASYLDHPIMSKREALVFRHVHDLFGHLAEGNSIGPRGEFNAAIQHSQMYSPLARRAMLAETHGQNSVVNFSETVLPGMGASIAAINAAAPGSIYADQKARNLPEHILREFYHRAGIERARGGAVAALQRLFPSADIGDRMYGSLQQFPEVDLDRIVEAAVPLAARYPLTAKHLKAIGFDETKRSQRISPTESRSTLATTYSPAWRQIRHPEDGPYEDEFSGANIGYASLIRFQKRAIAHARFTRNVPQKYDGQPGLVDRSLGGLFAHEYGHAVDYMHSTLPRHKIPTELGISDYADNGGSGENFAEAFTAAERMPWRLGRGKYELLDTLDRISARERDFAKREAGGPAGFFDIPATPHARAKGVSRSMKNEGMTLSDFLANANPEDRDFLENLRSAHRRLQPHHVSGGKQWYDLAGEYGRQQARLYGIPERTGVGVLAALSAGTSWEANKTKYVRILRGHANGEPFPYSVRLDAHRKAQSILGGMDPEKAFSTSPKVGQFYRGLMGDLDTLTIDRWALRTATRGKLSQIGKGPTRSGIESAWRQVAKENNMAPAVSQAALWLLEKEESNRASGQLDFLARGGRVRYVNGFATMSDPSSERRSYRLWKKQENQPRDMIGRYMSPYSQDAWYDREGYNDPDFISLLRHEPAMRGMRSEDEGQFRAGGGPVSRKFVVHDPDGIHGRPAQYLAGLMEGLDVHLTAKNASIVDKGYGFEGTGKNTLDWYYLNARKGHRISVTADGPDANRALARVKGILGFNPYESTPTTDPEPERAAGFADFDPSIGAAYRRHFHQLKKLAKGGFVPGSEDDPWRQRRERFRRGPEWAETMRQTREAGARHRADADAFERDFMPTRRRSTGVDGPMIAKLEAMAAQTTQSPHEAEIARVKLAALRNRGRATGGDASMGAYIVNERGTETFVPRRSEHMIPPDVMSRLPKRGAGGPAGIFDINQPPFSVFQPPEDGWIIPNHLRDRIPGRARGGRVDGYSFDPNGSVRELGGRGRFVSPSDLPGRDLSRYEEIMNPLGERIGMAVGSTIRRAITGLRSRGAGGSAAGAPTPAPAPTPVVVVGVAPAAAPPLAAAFAAGAGTGRVDTSRTGPLPGIGVPLPSEIAGESIAMRRRAMEGASLITGRSSVRSALAGASSFLFGGREASQEKRDAADLALRDLRASQSNTQTVEKKIASTGFALAEKEHALNAARQKRGESDERFAERMGKLGAAVTKVSDKHEAYRAELGRLTTQTVALERTAHHAVEAARPTGANIFQNVASIGVATTGYGLITQGFSTAVSALTPVVASLVDELTGFGATATRVTSALGESTEALHGNAQAAVAQSAAQAGLSKEGYAFVDDRLRATASVKAGARAQGAASDLFRATIGTSSGVPEGLFGGYGGIGGGPILAELFGGGKGYTEQVAGDVGNIARRANPQATNSHDPFLEGLNALAPGAGTGHDPFLDFINTISGRVPTDPQSATKANDTLNVYLRDQNDTAKRGAEYLGTTTSNLELVRNDSAAARDAMAAIGDAAGDTQNALQLAKNGVVLIDKATGQVTTSINAYRDYWKDAVTGRSIADPATVIAQQMQQLRATFYGIDARVKDALETTLPAQQAFNQIQNPLINPSAGIVPSGGISAFGAGNTSTASGYLDVANKAQADLRAQAEEGLKQARARVAQYSPGQLTQFNSELAKAQGYSKQIADITAGISLEQANLSAKQYGQQIFYLNRQLSDAKGLAGEAFGANNLGALQRQSFMIGRQQTSLSLGLQQREITTNVAVAGFQAPGESPEERYARREEALARAKVQQKQLNLSRQQFGVEGQIFNVQAGRGVGDAQRAIGMAQAERQVALDVAAGGVAIANAEKAAASHLAKAGAIFDGAGQKFDAGLSTIVGVMAQYPAEMSAANAALRGVIKELVDPKTGLGAYIQRQLSAPQNSFPPNQQIPVNAHASGIVGMTAGPTHAYIGEAGREAVAIIRNPRAMQMGWSGGGGGTNISVVVTGNHFGGREDEERLAQRIQQAVERGMNRKAQLVGLRGPSY